MYIDTRSTQRMEPLSAEAAIAPSLSTFQKLRQVDEHGLLSRRTRHLAELIDILTSKGISQENCVLIECGAYHFRTSHSDFGGPYHGGISHFFALGCDPFGFTYRAYDFGFYESLLDDDLQFDREDCVRLEVDLIEKRNAILSINIAGLEALDRFIAEISQQGILPVLFSNYVLNDPILGFAQAFWQLPGMHIHRVYQEELCMERGIRGYDSFNDHIASFQKCFGLVGMRMVYSNPVPGEALYTWDTLKRDNK